MKLDWSKSLVMDQAPISLAGPSFPIEGFNFLETRPLHGRVVSTVLRSGESLIGSKLNPAGLRVDTMSARFSDTERVLSSPSGERTSEFRVLRGASLEDTLYVNREKGELYMEVLVPGPLRTAQLYHVEKRLATTVGFRCAACGMRQWKLLSDEVVRRSEGKRQFSCYKLNFVCQHCNRLQITAHAKGRSIFDKAGRSIHAAFQRLRGFHVDLQKDGVSLSAKVDKGLEKLERC